jgi:hypothetical protein
MSARPLPPVDGSWPPAAAVGPPLAVAVGRAVRGGPTWTVTSGLAVALAVALAEALASSLCCLATAAGASINAATIATTVNNSNLLNGASFG